MRHADLVPPDFQQLTERGGRVFIVIHHQDSHGFFRLALMDACLGRDGTGFWRYIPQQRQANHELTALTQPALCASTQPPCNWIRFLTMLRPMPSPPCVRARPCSACTNGSKTCASISGAMPMPESRTRATAHHAKADVCSGAPSGASEVSSPTVIQIQPPGSVYLAALCSRLRKTCSRRVGSPSTGSGELAA